MRTVIKGATVLSMAPGDARPGTVDIVIEGSVIAAVTERAAEMPGDRVIDGRDQLVIPGLVNGHMHSSEALFKGRYDNLPLELWMLYSYPILGGTP